MGEKLQFPHVLVWNLNSETGNFYGSDSRSEKFCDATLKCRVVGLFHVVIRNSQCLCATWVCLFRLKQDSVQQIII